MNQIELGIALFAISAVVLFLLSYELSDNNNTDYYTRTHQMNESDGIK